MSNRVLLESIVAKIGNGIDAEQIDQPSDGMFPISRIETIWDGVIDFERVKYAQVTKAEIDKYALQSGDILFSHINSPTHIGKTAIYRSDQPLIHGINLLLIRVDQKKCYPEYLNYYFKSKNVRALFRARCKKAVNQASLNQPDILELEVPLPPLTEQKRIASLLARADRLRQLRRTAHDLSDSVLQSVFLEMFGDPFRNEKGWERIEIAELIRSGDTINYGVVQPGDDFPNGTPVIRVGDLDNLDKDITSLKLIDPKIEASYKRSRIVGDEILIACVGSIGKIALATEKMKGFNIVRAVARVPADYSLVNRLFLAAYLSMPIIQDFFQRETRTVAQPTLNITQIEETPILMPPLSLQEEFAGVVARVESLRGRMGESVRQVEGLFESLLNQAFNQI